MLFVYESLHVKSISIMASRIRAILLLLAILPSNFPFSTAQTWIKSGYWYSGSGIPIPDINSALFTHLICAFGMINSSTYELYITPSDQSQFSKFSTTVRQKNPSVVTLLSIGGELANYTIYSFMVSQFSYRKSFINSSINIARQYGFDGLDFGWIAVKTTADMTNLGALFDEWRTEIESEARKNGMSQLILTTTAEFSPYIFQLMQVRLPVESIRKNLDWVHVAAFDYYVPLSSNVTGPFSALYDPASHKSTEFGINSWINNGLPASKLVLALPFFGYAWTLRDTKNNDIGAPAMGPALTEDGTVVYKDIKDYIQRYGAVSLYNSTYVTRYCVVGSTWIVYDDIKVVKTKVSYAKQRNLRGYVIWQVQNDANWELSQAAAEESDKIHRSKGHILLIIMLPVTCVIILLGFAIWNRTRRSCIFQGRGMQHEQGYTIAAIKRNDSHNSQTFSFEVIKAATNNFSFENKLGEGGYGPVYKGKLNNGQEVAVKRLSATSKQGFEEFKNEVLLTTRLQHVNLVRVLGFCVERQEKMLIYEYMPNKSLDFYIYDPIRRLSLDWEKRVHIIEGVIQGLLYLQEYSRLTIVHRDLKASNILLDNDMKPKISDFGLARIFENDEFEANTDRIVGTYGYIPPEYVRQGMYSTKSDVFGFGVLLLQIMSGRKNTCLYGPDLNLNLLEYAYELWRGGKFGEFVDESLINTISSCALNRIMQIALLCLQENPIDRPTMLEIFHWLKNENIALTYPKRPAFSVRRDEDGETSKSSKDSGLVDRATITTIVAR